jgi:hypothetical protein
VSISQHDKDILRGLGGRIAAIAALPINQQRAENAARINRVQHGKPTVSIYQIPWHEMNVDDELTLRCEDPFCQGIEVGLRQTLYCWDHLQGDMTVSGTMYQPLCINDTGFGIAEDVDIARTDDANDVVSRRFNIQISTEADAEKIEFPSVSFDPQATEEQYEKRCDIFDGIMPVEKCGVGGFWFAPWDELVRLTGVTEILMDMVLRPEYVHLLMDRFVSAWLHRLDQYEAQGLLSAPTSELWGVGAAQIFSDVSPEMHVEFALKHEARFYARWGHNYYGCCEPLDRKVGILRENIPNLRKISMSPWVDFNRAVEAMRDEFIFAWKPNPAVLAMESWDPEFVRRDMEEKLDKAKDCIVEIHMKDISTVRYEPQRLWEWARIASEVAESRG